MNSKITTTSTENLPSGSFGLPFIGETISFLREPNFIQKRQQRYGSIFKTHLFGSPTVVLIGAEANRFLFTNEKEYFSNSWPYSSKVLLGSKCIVVQTGTEHQKRRKLLSQAFQTRLLSEYILSIEKITYAYLAKWEKIGTFTWYPELKKYTFDIACKTFLGIDAATEEGFLKLFEEFTDGIFSLPISLPWTKFGRALHAREQLMIKIEKIIRQSQVEPLLYQNVLGKLLQAEDQDGGKLSIQEVKEQLLGLLTAAHDTLASALTSLCMLLAQHPKVLINACTEQKCLTEQPLTLENLKQMEYLEQVLKEVLRLIPPFSGTFRRAIKPCKFNGYLIPQGWSVFYQIGSTHQDSNTYTKPQCFDPERFAPERAEDKTKTFSYIPFAGGTRECLGKELAKLEMKLFATLLIRNYQWELVPDQNLNLLMLPTARPYDGLKVKFIKKKFRTQDDPELYPSETTV